MKNVFKVLGLIALTAMIGFSFAACGGDDDGDVSDTCCRAVGSEGDAEGIIIYHKHSGFKVGSETCYYLEAAPSDQATITYNHTTKEWEGPTWCNCTKASWCNVKGATGTAIGTGKANTTAIINFAAHSGNTASNNAAKAVDAFNNDTSKNGGKDDWFLPSKDELNAMYKAKSHLGNIGGDYWSSSQLNDEYNFFCVWYHNLTHDTQNFRDKDEEPRSVRAIRYIDTLSE